MRVPKSAGRDWEGHDFHSCRKDPLTLVIPSEARNLLFSVPDFYGIQPQFKNPNATQRRFRGEITIARHVSTSSETDPDPGRHHPMPHRTARHYPEQLRPTPQQM